MGDVCSLHLFQLSRALVESRSCALAIFCRSCGRWNGAAFRLRVDFALDLAKERTETWNVTNNTRHAFIKAQRCD